MLLGSDPSCKISTMSTRLLLVFINRSSAPGRWRFVIYGHEKETIETFVSIRRGLKAVKKAQEKEAQTRTFLRNP